MTYIKIKDLVPKTVGINIIARVIIKGEGRMVKTKYGHSRVCSITIADETGAVTLSLWGSKINEANFGDLLEIKEGFCGEWQGLPQLSLGREGSMTIIEDKDFPDAQTLLAVYKEQNLRTDD